MTEPTTAEIRKRHDAWEKRGIHPIGHEHFVQARLQDWHVDRGILLCRLEACEQELKNAYHDIDQSREIQSELLNIDIPALEARLADAEAKLVKLRRDTIKLAAECAREQGGLWEDEEYPAPKIELRAKSNAAARFISGLAQRLKHLGR